MFSCFCVFVIPHPSSLSPLIPHPCHPLLRIYPRRITDKFELSRLLAAYIAYLADSPLQVTLKALAHDTQIPESVFVRLMALRHTPEDAANIEAEDFHILFSNVMFRYPTVKMWRQKGSGEVFFEA